MGGARRGFWRIRLLIACMTVLFVSFLFIGKVNPTLFGKIKTVEARYGRLETRVAGSATVLRFDQILRSSLAGRVTLLASPYRYVDIGDLLAEIDTRHPDDQKDGPVVVDEPFSEVFYETEKSRLTEAKRDIEERLKDAERVMRDALSGGQADIVKEAEARREAFTAELAYIETSLAELDVRWETAMRRERTKSVASLQSSTETGTVIQSPAAGVLLTTFDGLEDAFFPGMPIDEISEKRLRPNASRVEDGLQVDVGDPILRISDGDDIELVVRTKTFPLEPGARVTVFFGQTDRRMVTARVTEIDVGHRVVYTRMRIEQPDDILFDTRYSDVVVSGEDAQGIIVPASSIVRRGQTNGVYLMLGDRPIFREVRLFGGNETEVVVDGIQGVPVGAPVVLNPQAVQ